MTREPKSAGLDGAAVALGGRTWVMADLAPRQFRKVIPAMLGLGAVQKPEDLDETQIDRLLDAIYHALTRNYPDLTRDEFLDLPITLKELIQALPALAMAAGIERREAPASGERTGAAAASTASSTH